MPLRVAASQRCCGVPRSSISPRIAAGRVGRSRPGKCARKNERPAVDRVARGAYFEVAPAPRLERPRWYTALLPSGRVCLARATEQVVIRTPSDTPPVHVGIGLVLEGCLEPNAYGFLAVEGRHRDAARFDPIRLDRDALPPWAPSGAATVGFRFETDGPTFLVVEALEGGRLDRWTLGNEVEARPGVEVDHDPAGDTPLLLEIDGHTIVVAGRSILEQVDGALQRTGSLDEP